MWSRQVIVSTSILAIFYFLVGVISVFTFFRSKRLLLIVPIVYTCIGSVRGFLWSAVLGTCVSDAFVCVGFYGLCVVRSSH